MAGQGPYFGQATWFGRFHPEKVPSATDRYVTEIFRVTGVLDTALEKMVPDGSLETSVLMLICRPSLGLGLAKEY